MKWFEFLCRIVPDMLKENQCDFLHVVDRHEQAEKDVLHRAQAKMQQLQQERDNVREPEHQELTAVLILAADLLCGLSQALRRAETAERHAQQAAAQHERRPHAEADARRQDPHDDQQARLTAEVRVEYLPQ